MTTSYVATGRFVSLTAPEGGVASGRFYTLGSLGVIACTSADAGQGFVGATEGIFDVSKPSEETWTKADRIYWDGTAFTVTPIGSAIGICLSDAPPGMAGSRIRLFQVAAASQIEVLSEDPPAPSSGGIAYFILVDGAVHLRVRFPNGDPQEIAMEGSP